MSDSSSSAGPFGGRDAKRGVFRGCCGGGVGVAFPRTTSHHGALGGGEVDGVDACGQSFLQVMEDVRADAGAWHGALGRGGFVQQLLEAVELDQQHHVLQEIAFDKSRELCGAEELHRRKDKKSLAFFWDSVFF